MIEKQTKEVSQVSEVKETIASTLSAPKRAPRKPFRDEGRMKVPGIPGYHTYWFNSDSERHAENVARAKEAWWEVVLRKELYGEECTNPNDPVRVSDPFSPMLMKIPLEYYEEDQAERDRANKAVIDKRFAATDSPEQKAAGGFMDTHDEFGYLKNK